MSTNQEWMYSRIENGFTRREFINGVNEFITYAKTHCRTFTTEGKIRCPCNHTKCRNRSYYDVDTVELHILRRGFVPGYHCWSEHGEEDYMYTQNVPDEPSNTMRIDDHEGTQTTNYCTSYHEMVHNLAGPSFNWSHAEQRPTPGVENLYDMLDAASQPLWQGCEKMTKLSAVARLLKIKAEHHISEKAFDEILQF
ncbi:hypothetical protein Scep_024087 [Stephania cephalantha]|uniref:Transposase-associated domain-containing protein n=1 Tax=Stephania cephalantha TaxID=152367 RepID=A0AAP0EYS5_9MAGN